MLFPENKKSTLNHARFDFKPFFKEDQEREKRKSQKPFQFRKHLAHGDQR